MHFYNEIIIFMPRSRGENVHWPLHRTHSSWSNAKRRIANPIPIPKPCGKSAPIAILPFLHITASITRNNKAKMASGATMCLCDALCLYCRWNYFYYFTQFLYGKPNAATNAHTRRKNELLQSGINI